MAHTKRDGRAKQGSTGRRAGEGTSTAWLNWALLIVAAAIVIAVALSHAGLGRAVSPASSAGGAVAAPDFTLTAYQGADVLGGEEIQFSRVLGQGKPVVLNFWAGLCPPCRAEMPFFQRVYDELGDQFILVGLDIGPFVGLGSREDGQSLLGELGITYPAGTTFEAGTVAAYKVRGMPTTVFLTPDGGILETHTGLLTESALRDKVQALIRASGDS